MSSDTKFQHTRKEKRLQIARHITEATKLSKGTKLTLGQMFKAMRSQLHTYSYTLRILNKHLHIQARSNTNTALKKHMHTVAKFKCISEY